MELTQALKEISALKGPADKIREFSYKLQLQLFDSLLLLNNGIN